MKRRSQQPDFLTMILTELGKGIWFLISWPIRKFWGGKRPPGLDPAFYQARWAEIRTLADASDDQHLRQAIMEADKLLDHAMREKGRAGETFGERIRTYERSWEREVYQGVWEAHKLRNRLAHEMDAHLTKQQADVALMGFYKGLRSVGAL